MRIDYCVIIDENKTDRREQSENKLNLEPDYDRPATPGKGREHPAGDT
jgi:hypothetical protein